MYHFSIVEPFNLNWKYVAPKDFETLEYFLTPTLSVEFKNITNGPNRFLIGAYLANGDFIGKFNNEILPGRSQERIEKAFKEENISAFFDPTQAEALKELFDKELFICRNVAVKSKEHGVDLFALPEAEFSMVMDLFSKLDVQQTADIKASQEVFEDLRKEVESEIKKKHQTEERAKILGSRTKDDVKMMKIKAAVGMACVILAGVATFAANRIKDKGITGALGAIGLKILSSVTGIFGVKIMGNAAEVYAEGMV